MPTTALDVTVQAQVLDLMDELKRETGAGLVLITHDMGVVAEIADRVVVMYQGRKVEEGPVAQLDLEKRHSDSSFLILNMTLEVIAPFRARLDPAGGVDIEQLAVEVMVNEPGLLDCFVMGDD